MIKFDFDGSNKPPFYSNLPVFINKEKIGKATSIVWSPKYSKYVGLLIAHKNIEQTINDYSILDKVNLEVSEIT